MSNDNRSLPASPSFPAMRVMLTVSLILFLSPTVSRADDIVFTNFGPGNGYNLSAGNPVGNAFDGNEYAEGDVFTPSRTEFFGALTIALSCLSSCPDSFAVSLTSNFGGVPGAVLATSTVRGGLLGAFGSTNAPLVITGVGNPLLIAGTSYWITVSSNLNDSIVWNLNSTGDTANQAVSLNGGITWLSPSGQTPGAFEVQGSETTRTVPEPDSLSLLLTGIFAVVAHRRWYGRSVSTRQQ